MSTYKSIFVGLCVFVLFAGAACAERMKLGDLPQDTGKTTPKEQEFPGLDTEAQPGTAPAAEKPLEDNVAEEFYQKGMKALNEGRMEQAEAFFDRVLVIKPNHKGAQEGIAYIMQTLEDPKPSTPIAKPDPKIQLLEKLQRDLDTEIKKDNWDEANAVAAKMLAIDPNHAAAKTKLGLIKQKLHDAAVDRAKERESQGDYAGAIDAYRSAQSFRNDPLIPEIINGLRRKMAENKGKESEAFYLQALQKSQEGKIDEAIALCKQALAKNPDNFQAQRMLDRLSQPRPTK
jgi:tetratricopeptide (TPR) repeat protein